MKTPQGMAGRCFTCWSQVKSSATRRLYFERFVDTDGVSVEKFA